MGLKGFIHASQGHTLWRVMAVSELAERRGRQDYRARPAAISRCHCSVIVHGQVTIISVESVCLFVCADFFSAVFDPISIKLGHMLYVWV